MITVVSKPRNCIIVKIWMAFCGFQGNEVITLKEQHLLSKFSFIEAFFLFMKMGLVYNEKEFEKSLLKWLILPQCHSKDLKNTSDPTMYIFTGLTPLLSVWNQVKWHHTEYNEIDLVFTQHHVTPINMYYHLLKCKNQGETLHVKSSFAIKSM